MNMKTLLIMGILSILAACHHQVQPQESALHTNQIQYTTDLDEAMATVDMAEFAFRR